MAYSKGKHSAKSKTRNKNKVTYIVIPAVVAIGLFIGYKEISSAVTSNDSEISQNLASLPQDIINTDNPAIAKLVKMAPMYPRIYNILNNVNDYPQKLLVMASKKPETINFVADYPEHKGGNSTSENITVEGEYTKGEIPLFMQWDERWGYDKYGPDFFAINGCGPTALSMVTVGLTGNTNMSPRYVENFSQQSGYLVPGVGTAWSLMTDGARKLGLKSKVIPLSSESIINTLEKGHPIIATMGPGHFTTEGHYIVLTGVDSDGKIIVNDSDSKQRSSETWDVDVFLKEAKNLWAFSL
ncbi:MAG: C39 family peptidase [Paraclostridium sordellii]|uniref:C39 family peptidase n=1 Tax=Paraclostridium sordellii TaxID=1505 RepID=UPI0005DD22DE|nr:C39 family peptidase [Paeniclostridium sordellii]CEN24099.1 murein hydrolase domain-containing protein [[Clostridium] sordellii] [Paeniclostridium sordellii]